MSSLNYGGMILRYSLHSYGQKIREPSLSSPKTKFDPMTTPKKVFPETQKLDFISAKLTSVIRHTPSFPNPLAHF